MKAILSKRRSSSVFRRTVPATDKSEAKVLEFHRGEPVELRSKAEAMAIADDIGAAIDLCGDDGKVCSRTTHKAAYDIACQKVANAEEASKAKKKRIVPSLTPAQQLALDNPKMYSDRDDEDGGSVEVTLDELLNAIELLDKDKPENWIGDGRPDCKALSDLLERPVSASERDDAWKEYLDKQLEEEQE